MTVTEFDKGTVEINWTLPTIAVRVFGVREDYFLQGEEAASLLRQAEVSALDTEEFILTHFLLLGD